METTTTETTQAEGWKAAADASAEAEIARKQAAKPPRSFVEKLACKLTERDLAKLAKQIAKVNSEAKILDEERKAANDGFKAQIALVEQRRDQLIAMADSETELRDVEMVEEFIFATNTVRISRADTKEVVRERAMTVHERQPSLPGTDPDSCEEDASLGEDEPAGRIVDEEDEPIGDVEIVDPQALFDGSASQGDAPKAKRGRARGKA